MRLKKIVATLLCMVFALIVTARAFDDQPVYQLMYDLQGNRDVAYSGKIYPAMEDAYIVTGVSTTPSGPGSTGLDFFALMVNTSDGSRIASFGNNGFVKIDFGNIGGTSRTDVATELVFMNGEPSRIAILGESVVSKVGNPTNLSFAIAMIDSQGSLVTSFGNNGLGLYDIESGANDEIFFGDVDDDNNIVAGGFANPTPVVGAGPAFNCAVLKINQFGARDVNWGHNGQLIIDFTTNGTNTTNAWDERCRTALPLRNSSGEWERYLVGGRSKPAPGLNMTAVPPVVLPSTPDQTNFRSTLASIDYDIGAFSSSFGGGESALNLSYVGLEFNSGLAAINTYNGSFETIKMILFTPSAGVDSDIISLGNWGGWDYGVSGNKAIGLLKWKPGGEIDRTWGNGGGVSSINPNSTGGQSYDMYSLASYCNKIYVVGGLKATSGNITVSPPLSIIARFILSTGGVDTDFGVNGVLVTPQIVGSTMSYYKSMDIKDKMLYVTGEVGVPPGTSAAVNVLIAKYNLSSDVCEEPTIIPQSAAPEPSPSAVVPQNIPLAAVQPAPAPYALPATTPASTTPPSSSPSSPPVSTEEPTSGSSTLKFVKFAPIIFACAFSIFYI